jgi:superfamily I DNA/RNA helicase
VSFYSRDIIRRVREEQYERSGPPCDSVIRLFYVGATRAREALYICQRETGMAVTI